MSSRVPLLLLVAATSLMAVLYLGRRRRRSAEPTQDEPATKARRVEEPASPRSVLDGVEEPAVPPSVLDNAEQRTRITHREYTFASTGERLPYALFVPPQLQEPAPPQQRPSSVLPARGTPHVVRKKRGPSRSVTAASGCIRVAQDPAPRSNWGPHTSPRCQT